jgi:hypothetical protein
MLLLILLLLLLWMAGVFVPISPVRGNNAWHLVVLLVIILVLYELFIGGGLPRLRFR